MQYDRAKLALKLQDIYRVRAKENQGTRTDIPANSPESYQTVDTREEIAKIAGVVDWNSDKEIDRPEHLKSDGAPPGRWRNGALVPDCPTGKHEGTVFAVMSDFRCVLFGRRHRERLKKGRDPPG